MSMCRTMKTSLIQFPLLLAFFVFMSVANAQVQKWVDADGKVHYGNYPPSESDSKPIKDAPITTVFGTSSVDLPEEPAQGDVDSLVGISKSKPFESRSVTRAGKATLFATSWCGYCKKARTYLRRNGIAYSEYDIEKNPQARVAFKRYGDTGVPLLVKGDKHLRGFSVKGYNNFFK